MTSRRKAPQAEDLELLVYEEWVAHPDQRRFVPRKDHDAFGANKGWFSTGWKGMGPHMRPLSPAALAEFSEDDNAGASGDDAAA